MRQQCTSVRSPEARRPKQSAVTEKLDPFDHDGGVAGGLALAGSPTETERDVIYESCATRTYHPGQGDDLAVTSCLVLLAGLTKARRWSIVGGAHRCRSWWKHSTYAGLVVIWCA